MNVSFDFDHTLDTDKMQNICKKFLELGAEVFITTSRTKQFNNQDLPHADLFQVADNLGIKRENITFTNYQDKYDFLKDMDMHFDDDVEQIFLINQNPIKCIGFLFEEKHNNQYANF